MISDLLDRLRYKSEGPDLDFKSAQYPFANAPDTSKSELLKDILAIANAPRDGVGHILVGFEERRPSPAEPVGISVSLDDASLQQFVNSKVNPKLTFRYEEHTYQGKTVGVFTIPKQRRPFFLAQAYGKLKSNVVYVRRGSSTDEATPLEVIEMEANDSGRRDVRLELLLQTKSGQELPDQVARRFLIVEAMPDCSSPHADDDGVLGMYVVRHPLRQDNRKFWRQFAEYARVRCAMVQIRFLLRNSSEVQLSNAKLEVSVDPLAEQVVQMIAGDGVPEKPEPYYDFVPATTLQHALARQARSLVIDDGRPNPVCSVRFGTLLPGEEGISSDTLVLVPSGPGKFRLRTRVLASELAAPRDAERIIEATGETQAFGLSDLKALVRKVDDRDSEDTED